MPHTLRELRADRRREGFRIRRQKSSHATWGHPLIAGEGVELAGKEGSDARTYQERQVQAAVQRARQAARESHAQRQKGN